MLQQVLILEQELVYASLGLQPRRRLSGQLVLQQVDLRDRREWVSVWEIAARGLRASTPAIPAPLSALTSIPPNDLMKKPFPAGTHRCDDGSGGKQQRHTRARSANPAHSPLVSLMEKPEAKGGRQC